MCYDSCGDEYMCVCVPSGSFLTDVFIVRVSYCFLQTLLEQEIDSDRISALELGTRRKRNLAGLEEVRYSNDVPCFDFSVPIQSIELRFQDADSSEMSIGGDLLSSIQQSLSQVGGLSIKRLSTNNDHLVCLSLMNETKFIP